MNNTTSKPLVVMTIKDFVTQKSFTQLVPKVRENVNKYPFVTFINSKNEAENVYFSKNASKIFVGGVTLTKELLKPLSIAITHNEAGEERIKLITNSERVEISSLLD